DPFVEHEPLGEVSAGKPFTLSAQVVGIAPEATLSLVLNNLSGVWKTIRMERQDAYTFRAAVPAEVLTPGMVTYRIVVQQGENDYTTFPGNHKGNPFAWDYYQNDTWQTYVAAENGALEIFNAGKDRSLMVYPNLWRSDERQLITAEKPGQLILKLTSKDLTTGEHLLGWQHYIADKLEGRKTESGAFSKIVIRGRTAGAEPLQVKITFISADATAHSATVTLNNTLRDIEIPLNTLKPDRFMLLPRPYPGFHPFWFNNSKAGAFQLNQVEKVEVTVGHGINPAAYNKPYSLEVESIRLIK
ncbi:membrane or secreted protein, partial [Pontibacter sp. HJ8]